MARQRAIQAVDSWDGVDRGLFDDLRALRLEKARETGLPPYIIFGDVALRDMARQRPMTLESFLKIRGVGVHKQQAHGAAFIERIAKYCQANSLPTDAPISPEQVADGQAVALTPSSAERQPSQATELTPSQITMFALFDKQLSIEEVMQQTSRAKSTVMGYLIEYLQERHITDPARWVEAAVVSEIEVAIGELGPKPFKPLFEHLQARIDYERIRIVSTCWINRHELEG